jgi:hypothetical protein
MILMTLWTEREDIEGDLLASGADKELWPAAGFVDTGLGLHSSVLERHGA